MLKDDKKPEDKNRYKQIYLAGYKSTVNTSERWLEKIKPPLPITAYWKHFF